MGHFYIKNFSLDGGVERHSVNTFSVRLIQTRLDSVLTQFFLNFSQVNPVVYQLLHHSSPHYQKVDFSSVQCILYLISDSTLAGLETIRSCTDHLRN